MVWRELWKIRKIFSNKMLILYRKKYKERWTNRVKPTFECYLLHCIYIIHFVTQALSLNKGLLHDIMFSKHNAKCMGLLGWGSLFSHANTVMTCKHTNDKRKTILQVPIQNKLLTGGERSRASKMNKILIIIWIFKEQAVIILLKILKEDHQNWTSLDK